MGKYRVKHHLKRDGKEYEPGDSITLTAAEAQKCGSALDVESADEAAELAAKRKADDEAKKKAEDDTKNKGTA